MECFNKGDVKKYQHKFCYDQIRTVYKTKVGWIRLLNVLILMALIAKHTNYTK